MDDTNTSINILYCSDIDELETTKEIVSELVNCQVGSQRLLGLAGPNDLLQIASDFVGWGVIFKGLVVAAGYQYARAFLSEMGKMNAKQVNDVLIRLAKNDTFSAPKGAYKLYDNLNHLLRIARRNRMGGKPLELVITDGIQGDCRYRGFYPSLESEEHLLRDLFIFSYFAPLCSSLHIEDCPGKQPKVLFNAGAIPEFTEDGKMKVSIIVYPNDGPRKGDEITGVAYLDPPNSERSYGL
jgi:hypothetical protein